MSRIGKDYSPFMGKSIEELSVEEIKKRMDDYFEETGNDHATADEIIEFIEKKISSEENKNGG